MAEKWIATSKFLALVLRHNPGVIGASLDSEGWIYIDDLISKCEASGKHLTREILSEIVSSDSKRRYAYSEDKNRVRASQGHSIAVDLKLEEREPPEFLYHGTVEAKMQSISTRGLQKMSRTHVHLSPDIRTAIVVGARRGEPIILKVSAKAMREKGYKFYLSDNGVWLTNQVPHEFLTRVPKEEWS